MKKLNKLFKSFIVILSLLLIMGNAQGNVYGEEASTLTFTKCQSGMSLHLYRVADGKFGSYKYTEAFLDAKNANININKLQTSEEAQIAATTLMGYAVNKEDSHFIASGNKVRVEGLSAGLYLLVIDDFHDGHKVSRYLPYLIDVSTSKEIALTKYSNTEIYQYKLLKQWNGTNNPPKSITVDLYVHGKKERTVILEKEKNYAYSWKTNSSRNYSVVEHKVEGYKNTVSTAQKDGIQSIVLTNTKDVKKPPHVKTGDSTNITIYIFLLALSGLALILKGKRLEK